MDPVAAAGRREPFRQYLALVGSDQLFERFRPQIFGVLLVAWLAFMALVANHFMQGRWPQGLTSGAFTILLFVNAVAYYRQKPAPVPLPVIMAPAVVALAQAAYTQGLEGLVWTFPAVLLFHFLAHRTVANTFSLLIALAAVPIAWTQLGAALAGRFTAALLLTVLFMNVFATLAARQQRREAEQAHQLELQNAALREAIRLREEVERIARHDLKTPLNTIASVPRLLREHRSLSAREDELLGMVERSALRVLSMVNLSLDLYRMEEGSYRLRPQGVDLAAVVQSVVTDVQAHAGTKGVHIVVDAPAADVLAHAEELLCYTILANLVKNALEAAPDHSEVRITLHDEGGGQVSVSLHNLGAVPARVRERFFEKYATYGKAGGTGLGAYSARLLARTQHGELSMRSSEEEGTALTLALPRLDDPLRAQFQAHGHAVFQQTGAGAVPPVLAPLRVLVVDDDEYNILLLRTMLPCPPLQVTSAINGRAALQAVQEQPPDIVFMDLEMPVMGGYEAVRRIRATQAGGPHRSIVVAFSAHDDEATREACRRAGFDAYLPKPASRPEIMALLGTHAAAVEVSEDLAPLIPEFLASRRVLVAQLQEAMARGDRQQARLLAHKLSGSLAMYGFQAASSDARGIELSCAEGDLEGLASAAGALARTLDTVQVRSVSP